MNLYNTLPELKRRLSIVDTNDDANLSAVLEAVSRHIDTWTGRHFFVVVGTRVFTYPPMRSRLGQSLLLGMDLVSVTTLKTDTAGDRTYATSWAATDYDLEPFEAPYQSPPAPYWAISRAPNGAYGFLTGARGIQIVGKWGYYEVLARSTTILGAAVASTTTTSITLSASPTLEAGQTLLIDSEQLFLSAISGVTGTVIRGVNGTTAATHLINAVIDVYSYPVISEACLLQASRLFRRKDVPFGVIGVPEAGAGVFIRAMDPDVKSMLSPFRRVSP